MAKQIFKQAPLPFIDQKRMFLKHFKQVLDNIPNDGEGWTIVDVFGGSGLLSHTAKHLKPKACVIYNDYDNYSERLVHIDDINKLRRIIANLVVDTPKNKRLDNAKKLQIIEAIEAFKGYKDLHILCSWLAFSGQQVSSFDELYKQNFWHCVRQSDYPTAEGYLEGIEIVREFFHQLVLQFSGKPNTLLVRAPTVFMHTSRELQTRALL